MEEQWKDYPEYESHYEFSDKARLRNKVTGRIQKPYLRKGKYFGLCLKIKGRKPKYMIRARMVAICWIPNPENKKEVNHKNGITWDDRISNLEWATPSENINHYYYTLRKGTIRQVIQMDMNGNFVKKWPSLSMAARSVNGSCGNITSTCRGKFSYAHGFKWKYA